MDVVALETGEVLLEFGDQVLVLVEEYSTAAVVQSLPYEGLVGKAKHEEITPRGAPTEDGIHGSELGWRHSVGGGGVGSGSGGVLKEGVGDGGGKVGLGSIRSGGGRWWQWGVFEESEEEGEGEEREKGEKP